MRKYIRKAACLLLCGCMLFTGCGREECEEPPEENAVFSEAGYRRTTLYYRSDEGFIVPVMKLLPWEEGIGKAALSHLIGTAENQREAAAKGLNTLLPDGVELSLRIADDKTATLNLMGLSEYADAESEAAMVTGVAETLLEFGSIDRVQFLFDGEKLKTLPKGTPVSEPRTYSHLNIDPVDIATVSGAEGAPLTLYFPNHSGSLYIPVTRYFQGNADLKTALSELLKGPQQNGLISCLPEGAQLLSCELKDGVLTLDFSGEIKNVEDTAGITEVMSDCIALTAANYGDINQLHILSEGELFLSGEISVPFCANEWNR